MQGEGNSIVCGTVTAVRYANCSGSSEAGSTEHMCSLTSFSKHLLKMGVRATGLQSFKHVFLFFLGMGTMVDFLKHEGTTDRERDRLKMSVKTPAVMLLMPRDNDLLQLLMFYYVRSHIALNSTAWCINQHCPVCNTLPEL